MSDDPFADLKEALEEALAFEHGMRLDRKVTRIQGPRPPKTLLPQPVGHLEGRRLQMIASALGRMLQNNL